MGMILDVCVCTGIRVCGSAQRLHDPHAPRAQFRHHQVSLEQTVSRVSEDAEGRVSAEHVPALRFRSAQVHDSGQQQLAEMILEYLRPDENRERRAAGSRGHEEARLVGHPFIQGSEKYTT